MIRDNFSTKQIPEKDALSVPAGCEITKIFAFIDDNIGSFFSYYITIKDSDKENRTSDYLISHFQICNYEQSDGFIPYYFGKNPTQAQSDAETDIGVFALERRTKLIPVLEFEAKRLSKTSNNKEYVAGKRGGIERFKRRYHASYASICGMFGYIQNYTPEYWVQKINCWLDELAITNQDIAIDWSNSSEKLTKVESFIHTEKYMSNHTRKCSDDKIFIWHYFIDLTNTGSHDNR
jgi:hypothetical protein